MKLFRVSKNKDVFYGMYKPWGSVSQCIDDGSTRYVQATEICREVIPPREKGYYHIYICTACGYTFPLYIEDDCTSESYEIEDYEHYADVKIRGDDLDFSDELMELLGERCSYGAYGDFQELLYVNNDDDRLWYLNDRLVTSRELYERLPITGEVYKVQAVGKDSTITIGGTEYYLVLKGVPEGGIKHKEIAE